MVEYCVKTANVVQEPSDLLVLKYAQDFYGAAEAVASRLVAAGVCQDAELRPPPGEFVCLETRGVIAPKRVLFLGTPRLGRFIYSEMQTFARWAIETITELGLSVRSLTTTIHGVGYGLDGGEALQHLVRGFQAGLSIREHDSVARICFLTLDKREARMLSRMLASMAAMESGVADPVAATDASSPDSTFSIPAQQSLIAVKAGATPTPAEKASRSKKRVFVAMPFSEDFQNVYEFGIYPAVRNCGFICERVDEAHFTGDVLSRIRGGIEEASLVIADLTEGRPNVYLEVGYAWGLGIPVVFVAKKGEKLHFDVSTHRCVFYGAFTPFSRDLESLIRGLADVIQR